MKYLLLAFLSIFLTSCFGSSNLKKDENGATGSTSQSSEVISVSGPAVVQKIVDTSDPKYIKQQSIDKILAIKTVDELIKLYPHVEKANKKDHPKFLELEKKKILLGMEAEATSAEKNAELNKRLYEIHQGFEIWPESLKKLDTEYKAAVQSAKGNLKDPKIKKTSEARAKAFMDFKNSEDYKKYFASKEKELADIMFGLSNLMTPRAKSLQEEVISLNKEVYN